MVLNYDMVLASILSLMALCFFPCNQDFWSSFKYLTLVEWYIMMLGFVGKKEERRKRENNKKIGRSINLHLLSTMYLYQDTERITVIP